MLNGWRSLAGGEKRKGVGAFAEMDAKQLVVGKELVENQQVGLIR